MATRKPQQLRFKVSVGKPDDPGFIPAGTLAIHNEHVSAETEGAGDHDSDCVVVLLPELGNRRWSHPAARLDEVLEVI
jgi:hypothetical protein